MQRMLKTLYDFRILLAIMITLITITLSLLPGENIKNVGFINIPFGDKLGHFIAYSALGFFWANVMKTSNNYVVKTVLFLFSLGIVLELIQFNFLVGRFFEIFDIIANIIGSIVGIAINKLMYSRLDEK